MPSGALAAPRMPPCATASLPSANPASWSRLDASQGEVLHLPAPCRHQGCRKQASLTANPSSCSHLNAPQGEVLYLPALWWHQVEQRGSQEDSGNVIAVNYWSGRCHPRSPAASARMLLLATACHVPLTRCPPSPTARTGTPCSHLCQACMISDVDPRNARASVGPACLYSFLPYPAPPHRYDLRFDARNATTHALERLSEALGLNERPPAEPEDRD